MPSKTRHCLVKVGIAPFVGYTQTGEKLKMLGGYLDVRVLRGMNSFIALKLWGSLLPVVLATLFLVAALSAFFGASSVAWAGHLVHVALPASPARSS